MADIGDPESNTNTEVVRSPEPRTALAFLGDNFAQEPTILYYASEGRIAGLPMMGDIVSTLGNIEWEEFSGTPSNEGKFYSIDQTRRVVHFLDVVDERQPNTIGRYYLRYSLVSNTESIDQVGSNEPVRLEANITTDQDKPLPFPNAHPRSAGNSVMVGFKDGYKTYYRPPSPAQ